MMNSCLYECTVMHLRLAPKRNRFHYRIFMFYLDLDELDAVVKKIRGISRNRFNLFNFRDSDHLQLPRENPDKGKIVKEHIQDYLKEHGVDIGNGRIMLLTNLCTLGYQFNPVSFYYCFDETGNPVCSIAETGNTFGEMKPFFLGLDRLKESTYYLNTTKYFYVSPFIEMDTQFDFKLGIPGEHMMVRIDDLKDGKRFFLSTLSGNRKPLTNRNVFWYALRFPFITLQVITLIHWQAFKLWIRKLGYFKKDSHKELQRDVFRPHSSLNS